MRQLLLIDANSLIHRAFHALPPMTTASGEPSQAIYGVARILLKLWREERPDFAAALFDRPEPTFRDEIYKEYKAHRPPAPNELISQLIEIHNLFPLFGIKTFELPGYEADDLIATFAENFKKEKDLKITIFTGDLDSLQLVDGEKVIVRVPQKGISETTIYDPPAVEARYGLPPGKLPDYKALVGDASDNIKGVSGIGPKTAAKMLKNYKNLEELFSSKNLEPEFAKKLLPHKAQAMLAKKLVMLLKDAPVEIKNLEALETNADTSGLQKYFESKGFASLLKQIREPAAAPGPKKRAKPEKPQGSLF